MATSCRTLGLGWLRYGSMEVIMTADEAKQALKEGNEWQKLLNLKQFVFTVKK